MQRTSPPVILITICLTPWLCACGGLAGTGAQDSNSSSLMGSLSAGNAASITGFSPVAASVTAIPSSVTVNFSSSSLDSAAAQSVTYSISCGGNPIAAQSVTLLAGVSSVAVALPSITGLTLGTVCTFSVSNNLKDVLGNFVIGNHSVTYTLSAYPSVVPGWNEAAAASPTANVGSTGGVAFSGLGADGYALDGLLLSGTQYVDGIVGAWAPFGSSTPAYGPLHGSTPNAYTQLTCPAGYRMTGVYGRSGSYVDAVGIKCKNADQSQSYQSVLVGGSGGSAFDLSCPAGSFATDLNGRAGNYLDELSLGCR